MPGQATVAQAQDENILDTLKLSLYTTYIKQFNVAGDKKDSVTKFISNKLNRADVHLQEYVSRLVTAKDSSYYLKKKQELKEIQEKQKVKPTKELAEQKEKVLLELSILNPEASLSYYREWLQIIYATDSVGSKEAISKSGSYCFYKAFLYSILIKRFPTEKSYVTNLGVTYYNHAIDVVNSAFEISDATIVKQKQEEGLRFMNKSRIYMDRASKMSN
jgi:hypothetical protein